MQPSVQSQEKIKQAKLKQWEAYYSGWDDAGERRPFDPPTYNRSFYSQGWRDRGNPEQGEQSA